MTKEEMIEELSKFPSKDIRKLAGVADADCDKKATMTAGDFPADDFILDEVKEDAATDETKDSEEFIKTLDTSKDNKVTYYIAMMSRSDFAASKVSDIKFETATAKIGTKLPTEEAGVSAYVLGSSNPFDSGDGYYTAANTNLDVNVEGPISNFFVEVPWPSSTYIADGSYIILVKPDTEEQS